VNLPILFGIDFGRWALLIIAASVALAGCTKDQGKPVSSRPASVAPVLHADSCKVSSRYATSISKIVAVSCALESCHVSSGYKDFTSYDLLKSEIDAVGSEFFIKRIKPGGGMPPDYSTGPALSTCEIKSIEAWLIEGYPNN
jgi:hypothetical protein